jgi:signal recognition particle subunit SRP54
VLIDQHTCFFIGVGERIEDLQEFDATRYLSNVMGYGDLKGLLEKISDIEEKDFDVDQFDFDTFKKQLNMTKKIGSIGKLAGMLGLGKMLNADATGQVQKQMDKFNYIIDSMTKYERKNPDCLNSSRIKRIANGSGVTINDVHLLIKQYKTMRDTIDNVKGKDLTTFGEKDVQGLFKKQIMKKAKKKIRLK